MSESIVQLLLNQISELAYIIVAQVGRNIAMMAAGGHTWLTSIPGVDHHSVHIAGALITGTLLLGVMWLASLQLRRAKQIADGGVIPDRRLSLLNLFDLIAEGLYDFTAGMLGAKNAARFVPLAGGIFLFIFCNNLFGLIPGSLPSTENFNTTFGIGLIVFAIYNVEGVRELGLKAHIAHLFGPKLPLLMAPISLMIFCIEIISHCLRPFTLGVRLRSNMIGDHAVLGNFLGMTEGTWVPIPVIFYGLGLFVCFIQAFVFTLLTLIYIMLATAHEDDH